MPRKNRPLPAPSPHRLEAHKKSYRTRREAEAAATRSMLLTPEIELFVYQSPQDGKWYLTRKPTENERAR